MHSSPKMKKINTSNMFNNSEFITNKRIIKRSITKFAHSNFKSGNSFAINKQTENDLNKEKEKGININFNNININDKKKLSASFSITSEKKTKNSSGSQSQLNNSPINTESSTRESKKRNSAENNKMICKKNKFKEYEKFNTSNNDIKNIPIGKENIIKETTEEYTKKIAVKKPKYMIKYDTSDKLPIRNDQNKSKKVKKIVISSSLSEEKDKMIQKQKDKELIQNDASIETISTKINKSKSKLNKNNNSIKNNSNNNIICLGNKSIKQDSNNNNKIQKIIKRTKNPIKIKQNYIKDFKSEDYNILSILGEGTFSQIFLVENGKTHEKYALKKMTSSRLEDLEEKKKEFEFISKLIEENETLNLVKIYGIQIKKLDKFNNVLYILMDAAISDWETELKNRHFSKDYYSEEELIHILLNIVQTFSSLQKKGICHRDVKPQNILCFGNGIYKITDFGEAKLKKNKSFDKNCTFNLSKDTSIQTIRGTELYMSPILFDALRSSNYEDLEYNAFKSDVFSLGLCFLLAGCLSYKPLSLLRDIKEMDKIKLLIEKYLKGRYSDKFNEVILSMLQLEEKNRPDFVELENIIKKNL